MSWHWKRARFASSLRLRELALHLVSFILLASVAASSAHAASPLQERLIRQIVNTYGSWAIERGRASSVAVGIIFGDDTYFFGFGQARNKDGSGTPVTRDTIFSIGSNTKVFTTNLLGQFVAEGKLSLDDRLARFQDKIGSLSDVPMGALKRQITLGELGSFTAGYGDGPENCKAPETPGKTGCAPNFHRRYWNFSVEDYGAKDFLALIKTQRLKNYQAGGTALTQLPAPYSYSNTSTALIGLILGTPNGEPISNKSVYRWFDLVQERILDPLDMQDTYLEIPADVLNRVAQGFQPAYATAVVENGSIATIRVVDGGMGYDPASPPVVTIAGSPGHGATATAEVDPRWGTITSFSVTNGGQGYVTGPSVKVNYGNNEAYLPVILKNGRVAAVDSGPGWYLSSDLQAKVTGGQGDGTFRPAVIVPRFLGHYAHFFEVVDGGFGYVPGPEVMISPPPRYAPTWVGIDAAAGHMKSSARDMTVFLRAAMGQRVINGRAVPRGLRKGFEIAQRTYGCEYENENPCFNARFGLAWDIFDGDGGQPRVIVKNGAIPGYSSQIMISPKMNLGIVILAAASSSSDIGDSISQSVFYNLYFRCLGNRILCPTAAVN